MAHLTKPTQYKIEDSNIALLGSDLEKRVREHAGDTEKAWENAGKAPGIQIWRVEQFKIISWTRLGEFFNGDSYIVLYTYKKDPKTEVLSYDLHFWLGEETSQDEAGTAAYKTVELDDHLGGSPVQYREVQEYESLRFLSYFPKFIVLQGGTASGFRHVTEPPPLNLFNLYHVRANSQNGKSNLIVRQVSHGYKAATHHYSSDVFVLDKGREIWQYNTKKSLGKERFKAAEFVQSLVESRKSSPTVTVFDEGSRGAGTFLEILGEEDEEADDSGPETPTTPKLFRISDASGHLTFTDTEKAIPALTDLHSSDAFLLDNSTSPVSPAVYAWLGKESSLNERRYAIQYAQQYLWDLSKGHKDKSRISIVRLAEGQETKPFLSAFRMV